MNTILNKLDESVRSYLLRNRTEDELFCRECRKPLLDINNLKNVVIWQSKNGNDVIKYKNKKKRAAYYIETEHDRWCFFGKIMSGKVFYRHTCWKCFFKKLRATVDIARKARKGKWYKKIVDGVDVVPARCASPSPYFKLLFDITDEELDRERLKFATASYESFVMRFGEDEGKKRYDAYRARQAYTCSKEYMKETRGWTEEQWNEFNARRASTEENFIKRYGEELGKKKWKEYCAHEAYAGCALEYFIDKLGKDEGTKKYLEVNAKKTISLDNFVAKYGEEDGRKRFMKLKNKCYSDMSLLLFKAIDDKLGDFASTSMYALKNGEAVVNIIADGLCKASRPDYLLNTKIIEFNGNFWHANPAIYAKNDVLYHWQKQITAGDIWKADKKRKDAFEKLGYKVKVVWEHDYVEDPLKVIDDCVKFLLL